MDDKTRVQRYMERRRRTALLRGILWALAMTFFVAITATTIQLNADGPWIAVALTGLTFCTSWYTRAMDQYHVTARAARLVDRTTPETITADLQRTADKIEMGDRTP